MVPDDISSSASYPALSSPKEAPSSLTSYSLLSCPSCHLWWPGRPGSPWHFKWPHFGDPHLEGSPEHSEEEQFAYATQLSLQGTELG